MLEKLKRRIRTHKIKNDKKAFCEIPQGLMEDNNITILKSKKENMTLINDLMSKNFDIKLRELSIGKDNKLEAYMLFVDELCDKSLIARYIEQLLSPIHDLESENSLFENDILSFIENNRLNTAIVNKTASFNDVIDAVLSGDCALFIDGYNAALMLDSASIKCREVSEPLTESTLRGSREGFVEKLNINMSLIRNRIRSPKLSFELFTFGSETKTKTCIAYIDGLVDKNVLIEMKKRLKSIKIEAVLEGGTIEQLIEDHPFSPFATIGNSEKPDIVAAKLLEGKIAILCDGTPFVLIAPYFFIEAFHSTEDYFVKPYLSTMIRFIRMMAFFITLLLPPVYLALITFHQEMIPSVLFSSIAQSVENIPFPGFVETILGIFLFELIREAGVRMPSPAGQTVSIVGTLIIGQAAVQASFISNTMVIIISLSAVSSFMLTPILDAIIVFRFFFIVVSGMFGLYGLIAGILIMLGHMCHLKSFGQEYMKPFAPIVWNGLKDSFIRIPIQVKKGGNQ